jgi:hypothetical protein
MKLSICLGFVVGGMVLAHADDSEVNDGSRFAHAIE